jgi:pimeloyl-ACP methyl ester carboxylesterase
MNQWVTCSQGRFAYLSWGDEDAPLILCLHGFPDTPHSFSAFAEQMVLLGYRVIAPWLRGYAPSLLDGPVHIEQLTADVKALLEVFSPGKPTFIVGHDWGAAITYLALSEHPTLFSRAVTVSLPHPVAFFQNMLRMPAQLKNSWYMFFFQLGCLADYAVQHRDFLLIKRLWHTWSPGYQLSPAQWETLKECLSLSMPRPVMYYRNMFWPPIQAIQRLQNAKKIQVPLLYLHGAQDGCVKFEARRGQEAFFAAEHQEILLRNVGHFLPLEAPEAMAREIHRWFQTSP